MSNNDCAFVLGANASVSYDLGDHTGTSMTWNVTLPAGKKVLVSVEDASGNEAWSQNVSFLGYMRTSC